MNPKFTYEPRETLVRRLQTFTDEMERELYFL